MKKDYIETLYAEAEYYDTVKNTILYVMKSRGGISEYDLHDCINEVFLVALNKRCEVEEHPYIKGWLSNTAKNIVKRHIKSKAIQMKLFSDTDEGMPEVVDDDGEFQRLYIEFLDSLKANLKRSEYKLFTMKFVEERSSAEIAELFKKSKHAIDSRITRLKEKVKKILYET